jgi:hypothetical protein
MADEYARRNREADNTEREAKGTKADLDAGVSRRMEESDEKRSAINLAKGGEVDDRPRAMPGESAVSLAGRMQEYRRKKQAAQSAASR